MSSEIPEFTDMTLSAVFRDDMDAQVVREYYQSLLELGVAYVQIPAAALDALGGALTPSRTVLLIPAGYADIPTGFSGYIGAVPYDSPRVIREAAVGGNPPQASEEVRYTADASLFWKEYADVFGRLAKDSRACLCVRHAQEFGTALMVEWALAGGKRIAASFLGEGGYAPLEEVLAALHVCGRLPAQICLERLRKVSRVYERMTGRAVPAHKAVAGESLFEVESGVHVDGIVKNDRCYEPFAPEAVGAQRRIVIGKHSGRRALELKLEELGISPSCDIDRVLALVREASVSMGGAVDDDTLRSLARQVMGDGAA